MKNLWFRLLSLERQRAKEKKTTHTGFLGAKDTTPVVASTKVCLPCIYMKPIGWQTGARRFTSYPPPPTPKGMRTEMKKHHNVLTLIFFSYTATKGDKNIPREKKKKKKLTRIMYKGSKQECHIMHSTRD